MELKNKKKLKKIKQSPPSFRDCPLIMILPCSESSHQSFSTLQVNFPKKEDFAPVNTKCSEEVLPFVEVEALLYLRVWII